VTAIYNRRPADRYTPSHAESDILQTRCLTISVAYSSREPTNVAVTVTAILDTTKAYVDPCVGV